MMMGNFHLWLRHSRGVPQKSHRYIGSALGRGSWRLVTGITSFERRWPADSATCTCALSRRRRARCADAFGVGQRGGLRTGDDGGLCGVLHLPDASVFYSCATPAKKRRGSGCPCGFIILPSFNLVLAAVACTAKSQQVIFGVVAAATASIDVMNLQLSLAPARLTPPTIARQHTTTELIVGLGFKP